MLPNPMKSPNTQDLKGNFQNNCISWVVVVYALILVLKRQKQVNH